MNISEHISYNEAIHSNTAILKKIENIPDIDTLKRMKLVAENVFEPVRKFINLPISINSFYRSIELNKIIGGAPTSQHVKGEAIDMDRKGFNSKIFHYIRENLSFDQLIWEFGNDIEPNWVHCSYREAGNRKEILMSKRINGKTIYLKYK